jgi:hypothetical protein
MPLLLRYRAHINIEVMLTVAWGEGVERDALPSKTALKLRVAKENNTENRRQHVPRQTGPSHRTHTNKTELFFCSSTATKKSFLFLQPAAHRRARARWCAEERHFERGGKHSLFKQLSRSDVRSADMRDVSPGLRHGG